MSSNNQGEAMRVFKQQSHFYQENKRFLLCSYTSKEQFAREYRQLYYGTAKAEELYILLLFELEKAISEGKVNSFKKLSTLIDYITDIEDQLNLRNYYDNVNNPIKSTNLVILACKYNRAKILEYLLSNDCTIVNNLSIGIGKTTVLPDDEDEAGHNVFYHAIRSGNVELLDTLINKWPNNYFTAHLRQLDEILSKAYEELKLKNVSLSDKVEIFVESKLINLHFFSNTSESEQDQNIIKNDLNNIRERIELVLQNINLLKMEYLNLEKLDKKFLFILNFIAQNVHILKRQLKSSYIRLPWEEIEFCLICFTSSQIKEQEINLFYRAALDKSKMLSHLENFAKRLEDEKDNIQGINVNKLAELPKLKRDKVVAKIISNYPEFEELYNDYQQIRDVHSLEKISNYITLALSADPKEREGQLVITRVLQVIGEYLKNSLESPKLSSTTNEFLLLSLPSNTREIIIDLRNSLSHTYSLSKRTEIEENPDVNFFIGVQNDIKKIGDVITDICYNHKMKLMRILLKKIIDSENLNEIEEMARVLCNVKLDEMFSINFKMLEYEKLEKLIKELSKNVTDKTDSETKLFNEVHNMINSLNNPSVNTRNDYLMGFGVLKALKHVLDDVKIDHNNIRQIKFCANRALENRAPNTESYNIKKILELIMKIFHSVNSRSVHNNDEIHRLFCEIFFIAEFDINDIKWIEALREKLNEKGSFIPMYNNKQFCNFTEEKYNNNLALKLSELTRILNSNALSGQLTEQFSFYRGNKKLQAVIEMLVLDIISILGTLKHCLINNLLFLDDNASLLTGKSLRNHLAHDNALINVLLTDPSIAVIVNARKLTEENIMTGKNKIGKLVKEDITKLKNKYNQGLTIVTNQERMFVALEEGNLEDLQNCMKKGADINARSINSWTALHFAAKGPSIEAVKFVFDQNLDVNAKDINGQNPLHIAAAYGRKNIVEFFIKEARLHVDSSDNKGKTPLHVAAQNGHKDIVEVLLRNNANIVAHDIASLPPLIYAMRNNHIDVAKILLQKDVNIGIHTTVGGFTMLHEVAERGHLELVNFLLQNNADVNIKNDVCWTPLHAAALNGHLAIVNTLILKGADVNARNIDGCSALHYAVENGHEKIVDVLLKHGANVSIGDKTCHNTPLHYAAVDGHEGIVKKLLKNKANASAATVAGQTPVHLAVRNGHLEIVTVLLKHGVNIQAKDKNNVTPLHYAAEYGQKEVAELLIRNKAEINANDNSNSTPLHLAAAKGKEDIIQLLLKNKAKIDARDINGRTPLHAAATSGNNNVVDLLITNKAEVNAKANSGRTPLHTAVLQGHINTVVSLINNNADITAKDNACMTPLYVGVLEGHKNIVNILIGNKAQVNVRGIGNITPLHMAVKAGHKEIVEILIANGAEIDAECDNRTPLCYAVKHNHREIVKVLLANGANVNTGFEPLSLAASAGYTDIVEILLKNEAQVNRKGLENITALHLAASRGHRKIVNALIIKGADVNAVTINNATPLHLAAETGNKEIVEILIKYGAKVNVQNNEGITPLHMAAVCDHSNVIKVLVDNEANISIKDKKNRTALELAVARGSLQVVKMLLEYKKVDLNAKCCNDYMILHIASQGGNLEMVKYLVDEGCDINARLSSGLKPIHVAASEGHKDIVAFFLSKGLSINELGAANETLLHCAAMYDRLEVVKYLIAQDADMNLQDVTGRNPLHIAADFGYNDIVKVLLENGAICNAFDKFCYKPLGMAVNSDIIHLLVSTEKLMEAVKRNNCLEVESYIKAGASVNAKHSGRVTPLHYAAWKGYDKIVNILLQNKSNPNAINNTGFTPLHYAAKFSHSKVVKALLFNGAIYNAVSNTGKIPSDLSVDENITSLLKLVSKSFKNIENGDSKVINDLKRIKDVDTIKAIMGAHNRKNQTLVVAAMQSNFSKVEQLKEILQGDVSDQISVASLLLQQGDHKMALSLFKSAFEKRKEILGSNNPGTLDVQSNIAKVWYAQGFYQEALNMFEEIFEKQKEMLGLNAKDTLKTRSTIGLVLHRQGRDEEALNIYQEIHQKQEEILGSDHPDTLDTQFHMALVLDRLGKYEEALMINKTVLEKRKKILGTHHPVTVSTQNNIAMVLGNQGKYKEALQIYEKVIEEKKMILGINHSDTLRTLHNFAGILLMQKKYDEALKVFQDVLNSQKNVLGSNHPDTLNTQHSVANVLFAQQKWTSALKAYKEICHKRKAIFGPNHPTVLDILKRMEVIHFVFKFQGYTETEILEYLQKDINVAANNGDIETIQCLLKDGTDINDKDADGRTPLHFAINNQHIHVINFLLKNGADVTQATNKGNTPLHTAAVKGRKEIIEVLLQHTNHSKLNDFINAKTIASGSTSLHVAAQSGFLEIVKCLLKHGAIYSIENKEGKTPLNFAKDQSITRLLKLIEELFEKARNGNVEIISKLKALKLDEFVAVTNALNNQKNTLLQVVITNKHKHIVSQLLDMLRKCEQ